MRKHSKNISDQADKNTQPAAICRENAEMYMKAEKHRELMAFKPAKAEPTVATLSK